MTAKQSTITIVSFIFILSTLSVVFAGDLTLDQFIDQMDFNFNIGDINVSKFNDTMLDSDSNGMNDTLLINLTVNVTTPGTYLFLVDVIDSNDPVSNYTNITLSTGTTVVNVSLNTKLLNDTKWNYSVSAYNASGVLIFRRDKNPTKTYAGYEQGIGLASITDGNYQNKAIQINVTLTGTNAETVNVSVFLETENFTIFGTTQVTLNIGTSIVSVNVDNESIKSTHYTGSYNVTRIWVGDKIIARNYATAVYNYTTFAQTSYIDSFTDSIVDSDADGVAEWLEINVTSNIKQTGTYLLDLELRDLFGAYVTNLTQTQTYGTTGLKTMQMRFNGTEIYQSKINGPYVVSIARLDKDSTTTDVLLDAYTTQLLSFANFTLPSLPDVAVVNISSMYNDITKVTIVYVNVTNVGKAPAFNIFLDVFDNKNYENQTFVSMLEVNKSINITFNATNSSNGRIYAAIADFKDIIEESNESNNVLSTGNKPPSLSHIGNRNGTVDNKIIIDVNATDPDNDTLIYGTNGTYDSFNATSGIFIWTPTTAGNYSVLFNVTDGNFTVEEIITIKALAIGNLRPVLDPIGDRITLVNTQIVVDVNATDPETDILSYGTNATFGAFNNVTGILTWTPAATGIFWVTFNVTDGNTTVNQSMRIIVKTATTVDPFSKIVTGTKYNDTPWRGDKFFIDRFESYPLNSNANTVYDLRGRGIWNINSMNDENGNPTHVYEQNNVTQPPDKDTYETVTFPEHNFTNFTMTVKIQRTQGNAGTCGMIFRSNDTFFNTTFDTNSPGRGHTKAYGNYWGGCCDGATRFLEWNPLFTDLNFTTIIFANNTWFWIRVIAYGKHFEIYNSTDGQNYGSPLFVNNDTDLRNGTIGLYSDHGQCKYDELMVVEHLLNASNSENMGLAYHNENLTGIYMYTDRGGKNQSNVTFKWYRNGNLTLTQFNDNLNNINSTIDSTNLHKGDIWQFEVTFCNTASKCRTDVSNQVKIINNEPVFDPINDFTMLVNTTLVLDTNATDGNNDSLIYGTNATFGTFNTATGVFTWLPNRTGFFKVRFNATDGDDTDNLSIVITVVKIADELEGREAMENATNLTISSSNRTIFTDQQVYIRYENNTQMLGRFDKFVNSTSQRWLFNYNTTGENFTMMVNLTPSVFVWEQQNLTPENITRQTSLFINQTKS